MADKDCRSQESYEKRTEIVKAKQRAGQFNHTKKAWIERNPEKRAAHVALNNAVRDGRIMKPKQCPRCDRETRILGHHHDYTKPLDVEWMCAKCHRKEHEV